MVCALSTRIILSIDKLHLAPIFILTNVLTNFLNIF